MNVINIDKKRIGKGFPVFIIAEAGVNHNGSLDMAIKMVDEAKKAGADCIKFQTFEAENIETKHSLKPSYFLGGDSGLDKISYLKSVELNKKEFLKIKKYMARRKLEDKLIRKIIKNGDSYSITIPIEIMREFGWREKQKVVIKKRGKSFNVSDWKK